MIFKRIYVRKRFLEDVNKLNINGIEKKDKYRTPIFKKAIAVPLVFILLICSALTVVSLMTKSPEEVSPPVLNKLPAIKRDELLDRPYISHNKEYPTIDMDSIKTAPVFKHLKDTDNAFNNILDHFNIDKNMYKIEVKKNNFENGNGYLTTYSLNQEYRIGISSIGLKEIYLDKYEPDNCFEINIPTGKSKNEISEYLIEYVNNHYNLFNINANTVVFENFGQNYFYARIIENEPATDIEKIRYNLYQGEYVSIIYGGNNLSIYYNNLEELVGDYPIITSSEAIQKYRNGDVTCYDWSVEREPDKYNLSFEDEVYEVHLSYITDSNNFARPIYEIILKTRDNDTYIAAIDAIEEIYIY